MGRAPVGIIVLSKIFGFEYNNRRKLLNQIVVFLITFMAYASLHAARKVLPVVKTRLKGSCVNNSLPCDDGFEPFNSNHTSFYFTLLDASWGFTYALGMVVSGYVAEHTSRKVFLATSLFGTGACLCLFGFSYYLSIHSIYYFVTLQVLNGLFQSAGWPTIVAIYSAWIPKNKMGIAFGIWTNSFAVGNIIGQASASLFVTGEWGIGFLLNGGLCVFVSFIVMLFLASKPSAMGFESAEVEELNRRKSSESTELMQNQKNSDPSEAEVVTPVSFGEALMLPGVLEFSFSLFFCKIVVYTFLFWLPYYIDVVGIKDYKLTPSTAGLLAVLFEVGGIIGNIVSGYISDLIRSDGLLCFGLQIIAAISIYIFSAFGNQSYIICVGLLMFTGYFVNAPNSLITGSISANLAHSDKLIGNKRATSVVSAIIDGIGCLGAAVAPIIVGQISGFGWSHVMHALIVSSLLSALLLTRLLISEIRRKIRT